MSQRSHEWRVSRLRRCNDETWKEIENRVCVCDEDSLDQFKGAMTVVFFF